VLAIKAVSGEGFSISTGNHEHRAIAVMLDLVNPLSTELRVMRYELNDYEWKVIK
jgi:hypothetical protein